MKIQNLDYEAYLYLSIPLYVMSSCNRNEMLHTVSSTPRVWLTTLSIQPILMASFNGAFVRTWSHSRLGRFCIPSTRAIIKTATNHWPNDFLADVQVWWCTQRILVYVYIQYISAAERWLQPTRYVQRDNGRYSARRYSYMVYIPFLYAHIRVLYIIWVGIVIFSYKYSK